MKGLIGYLKRVIWIFSVLFLFTQVSAQTGISTSSSFSHIIKSNGYVQTTITLKISSEQRTVLTYYTVTIPQEDIEAEIFSLTRNSKLEATTYNRANATDILIDLENSVVSSDNPQEITISYTYPYENSNIIDLVSKVIDTPTSQVSVTYPKTFGETSWVSDQIDSIKQSGDNFIINITSPDSSSVKLIFNQGIVYQFNISKSFNNPGDLATQYELIIPQDSEFQKIIIENTSIQPTQAIIDNNRNYILIFTVDAKSQIDVKISGYAIMEYHQYYDNFDTPIYDSKNLYWSLENKQIEKVDAYLEENGITQGSDDKQVLEYLYKYTTEALTPSTSSTSLSGGVRRGAIEVLKDPTDCTPEDYADILKTLLNYYKIPSIYTIGYVSNISSYQRDGMFHYWIQAYDGENWLVLDPYLEDYSKVSLFGREQFDHISIMNRLYDPISPTLPYYSNSDIQFEYVTTSDVIYMPQANVSISLEPYSIFNKYIHGSILIENTGNGIITGYEFINSNPEINTYIDYVSTSSNSILLPHINKAINFHIPFDKIEDDIIFTTANIKNGDKMLQSELLSTSYTTLSNTGYDTLVKIISAIIFLLFLTAIYFFIEKVIYKR